ncbi:hypothetical protein [Ruminococcus sp. 5_1_39BFAA]|uniref:hypothetical protein n=1 Tax=Ruminococcus sp. 5_1_39BFAA TaxID=457412 RepID=UPI0035672622
MSKYNPLWTYIQGQSGQTLLLRFAEIETICGLPIDHSFLQYKKELLAYGWQVERISMKQQTVRFRKSGQETQR